MDKGRVVVYSEWASIHDGDNYYHKTPYYMWIVLVYCYTVI